MSMNARDREAFDLVSQRSFRDAAVVSFDLEMQTRRLTITLYGALQTGRATFVGTIRFFGTSALVLQNPETPFPESVRVESLVLSYDDDADVGSATVTGAKGWSIAWLFDGLSYDERSATIASLADDEDDE